MADLVDPILAAPRPPFDYTYFVNTPNHPFADLPPLPATDTLLYINPLDTDSPPLRVSSQLLLATKSPILEAYFRPTYQFRILRRKRLLENGLPLGIRFVVDFCPPIEGDDAVEMAEKLWVPEEVRSWTNLDIKRVQWAEPDCGIFEKMTELDEFRAETWGGASASDFKLERQRLEAIRDSFKSHVEEFRDDASKGFSFDPDAGARLRSAEKSVEVAEKDLKAYDGLKKMTAPSPVPPPTEYSLTRHVAALSRILALITHNVDPNLHSASMWYTFFLTARYLQLLHQPCIVDTVVEWLYRAGNAGFVERNTEFCLNIADELRASLLFRDCFALCVARVSMPNSVTSDSAYAERILAAQNSLEKRARKEWESLLALDWVEDVEVVPEQAILDDLIKDPKLSEAARAIKFCLKAAVRDYIDELVYSISTPIEEINKYNTPSVDDAVSLQEEMAMKACAAADKVMLNRLTWRKVEKMAYKQYMWWTPELYERVRTAVEDELKIAPTSGDWFLKLRDRSKVIVDCLPVRGARCLENIEHDQWCQSKHSAKDDPPPSAKDDHSLVPYLISTTPHGINLSDLDPCIPDPPNPKTNDTFEIYAAKPLVRSIYSEEFLQTLPILLVQDLQTFLWTPATEPLPLLEYPLPKIRTIWHEPSLVTKITADALMDRARKYIMDMAKRMLAENVGEDWRDSGLLRCLTDEEFGYMPEWAGGDKKTENTRDTVSMRVGNEAPGKDDEGADRWSVTAGGARTVESEASWDKVGSESTVTSRAGSSWGVVSDDGEKARPWEGLDDGEVEKKVSVVASCDGSGENSVEAEDCDTEVGEEGGCDFSIFDDDDDEDLEWDDDNFN